MSKKTRVEKRHVRAAKRQRRRAKQQGFAQQAQEAARERDEARTSLEQMAKEADLARGFAGQLEEKLWSANAQAAEQTQAIICLTKERDDLAALVVAGRARIESLAGENRTLQSELALYRAEDRDVAKLRRRLQERAETVVHLQAELQAVRSQIPPKPLIYGPKQEETSAPG